MRPVYYSQKDPKWGKKSYNALGEINNMSKAGCGPTSAAMILETILNKNITPITTADWSMKRGYKVKNQGTSHSYFVPQFADYGLVCRYLTPSSIYNQPSNKIHEVVRKEIENGNFVIALMGKGLWTSSGHYVVPYEILNGKVRVNDPASVKPEREYNDWNKFKSQVKKYWVIESPVKKVEPVTVVKEDKVYTYEEFLIEVNNIIKSGAISNLEKVLFTLVPTISVSKNNKHALVTPLERYFKAYGLYTGSIEADLIPPKTPVFGPKMAKAVSDYAKGYCKTDIDQLLAKGVVWKTIFKQ